MKSVKCLRVPAGGWIREFYKVGRPPTDKTSRGTFTCSSSCFLARGNIRGDRIHDARQKNPRDREWLYACVGVLSFKKCHLLSAPCSVEEDATIPSAWKQKSGLQANAPRRIFLVKLHHFRRMFFVDRVIIRTARRTWPARMNIRRLD